MTTSLPEDILSKPLSRVAILDTRATELEFDAEGRRIFTALAYQYEVTDTYNTTLARGAMSHVVPDDFRILEYHMTDRDPVGKPLSVTETADGPVVRFVFADTERAQELQGLVEGGFLRAVSIGFVPTDGYVRSDGVTVFTRADLHELSLVNTPASKGALISLARDLHAEAADVAAIMGLELEAMTDDTDEVRDASEQTDATPDDETAEQVAELTDDERRAAAVAALRDLGVDEEILAQLSPGDASNEAATVDGAKARALRALALIRRTRG